MTNDQTIRRRIIDLLGSREMNAKQLSQALGLPEKEVVEHLAHAARTLNAMNHQLIIRPAQCRRCGYVFENRKRLTKPGRCPQCKGTHLHQPTFRLGR